MRIKRVECEQFAGIQDKEYEFEKGLNLVVGDNETGKSTLVDLIFYLLFKDSKLDRRSDSEFIDRYFPKSVNGHSGDVIDGVLVFEGPDGTYKLSREWEKGEGTCKLRYPDGTIVKDEGKIKETLNGLLQYRAGVYNELVFASQKRSQLAVESIMKALGKKSDAYSDTRSDLTSTLTQAALETGGVSLEKLEKSLQKKLSDLSSKWDFASDAPEGGRSRASYQNAWKNGAGSIVKAYYEVDEVRFLQSDADAAERAVENENSKIQELKENKKIQEKRKSDFEKYRGILEQIKLLKETICKDEIDIREKTSAFEHWPSCVSNSKKAKELKKKSEQATVRELYLKAQKANEDYLSASQKLSSMKEVNPDDVKTLRTLISKKDREEGKLAGMNIYAKVKQLGDSEVSVTAISSGETLASGDSEISIKEAVTIGVPGVVEIQLMPQGVDVESVKNAIASMTAEINDIYTKYGVASLDQLIDLSDAYNDVAKNVEKCKYNLDGVLAGIDFESLKKANEEVPSDIEGSAEIKAQIIALCGSKPVDSYIGGLDAQISSYEQKYVSLDELGNSISVAKMGLEKKQKEFEEINNIPEEYLNIPDPDLHAKRLQDIIDLHEKNIGEHEENLRYYERKLGEKTADEYSDELQKKESVLEGLKAEYKHWKNINDVFVKLKQENTGNPVEDIETKFNEYLDVLSSGGLKLQSMDEKMSVSLSSGIHSLTYDILSDGTKDTISLAFRLAMLEHLYPKGDGLAVFDDPFTDMDPQRVSEACRLISKFAEKNQVIFITCDSKYETLMEGNVIKVKM